MPWNLIFTRLVTATPIDTRRGYVPIPPFSYPANFDDLSLTAPRLAIDCYSNAARGTWHLGVWARVETEIAGLPGTAIGPSTPIPINRGSSIIDVPEWARHGYQIQFEVPAWFESLTVAIYAEIP